MVLVKLIDIRLTMLLVERKVYWYYMQDTRRDVFGSQ